jgi:hypothetical protein
MARILTALNQQVRQETGEKMISGSRIRPIKKPLLAGSGFRGFQK